MSRCFRPTQVGRIFPSVRAADKLGQHRTIASASLRRPGWGGWENIRKIAGMFPEIVSFPFWKIFSEFMQNMEKIIAFSREPWYTVWALKCQKVLCGDS